MRIPDLFPARHRGHGSGLAGYDVFENAMEVKRRIGYLPEHPPLYDEMTVDGYLGFVARIKGVAPEDRKRRLQEVKETVRIEGYGKKLIKHLSKGFKQRVGLAQALIHDPEVLILDEPTVGLDPNQIKEVRELIKSLSGNHTIVLSTHILPEVSMTCQRVVIISDGKIVAVDTPENLTRQQQGAAHIYMEARGSDVEGAAAVASDRGSAERGFQTAGGGGGILLPH